MDPTDNLKRCNLKLQSITFSLFRHLCWNYTIVDYFMYLSLCGTRPIDSKLFMLRHKIHPASSFPVVLNFLIAMPPCMGSFPLCPPHIRNYNLKLRILILKHMFKNLKLIQCFWSLALFSDV